jgi:hypothetical protein
VTWAQAAVPYFWRSASILRNHPTSRFEFSMVRDASSFATSAKQFELVFPITCVRERFVAIAVLASDCVSPLPNGAEIAPEGLTTMRGDKLVSPLSAGDRSVRPTLPEPRTRGAIPPAVNRGRVLMADESSDGSANQGTKYC